MDRVWNPLASATSFSNFSEQPSRRVGPRPLTSAGPFLLGVQSLVQQQVGLVAQAPFCSQGPGSCEIVFRQPDCDRRRRTGLAGPLAGSTSHRSSTEFAGSFGAFKAVCDQVLIFRPPFSLLCLGFER
jgi:hypothetical protein